MFEIHEYLKKYKFIVNSNCTKRVPTPRHGIRSYLLPNGVYRYRRNAERHTNVVEYTKVHVAGDGRFLSLYRVRSVTVRFEKTTNVE